jgi:hypothetical protein
MNESQQSVKSRSTGQPWETNDQHNHDNGSASVSLFVITGLSPVPAAMDQLLQHGHPA